MLNPARAKSCTVASWSDPLGRPSLSFIVGGLLDLCEKTGPLSRVTYVAFAFAARVHENRVLVAIDQHGLHGKPVAGRLSLGPQSVAGPRKERHVAGLACLRERRFVHETHH